MLIPTLCTVLAGLLCYGLVRLRFIRFSQYAHLPGPPPSLLWGHLNLMARIIRPNPLKHFQYGLHELIKNQADDSGLMLLDLRPFFYPMTVIYSHELAEQITRATPQFKYSLPKAPLQDLIGHVTGCGSFLMSNGEQWKETRKAFNPAFAPTHLATFVPQILDKVQLFLHCLDEHAERGTEFNLGELCTLLTFDVIGRVILNVDVHSQGPESQQHDVVRCFRELLANLPFWPQAEWLLSPRQYRRRMKTTQTLERSLRSIIHDKFDRRHGAQAETPDRSVLSLSLERIDSHSLSPQTMQDSVDSIRTFLFAGYDTTSVLLQWALYELSRTPRALTALRTELDQTLGPDLDPASTATAILSHEASNTTLAGLPYLTAVIKETLRLHPPAGTSRFLPPESGFVLHTPRGPLCVDGAILYVNHFSIHRDRAVHGESADAWVPERWLDEPQAPRGAAMPGGGWRPFERGPRNCIGQDLAMLEARLVLAMAVRRYDFTKVGLGATTGTTQVDEYGQYVSAEPLYDTFNMSAKPVDGTRMRVRFSPGEREDADPAGS